MKIENNKVVSLVYELREKDKEGKIIEALNVNRPLTFIYGAGRLLPKFEQEIESLEEGNDFSFALDSESAYGGKREEMIVELPISIFTKDGKLEDICQVGNTVPMSDHHGNRMDGVVLEISENFVKMDFNHPMAGVDLFFTGKIVEVRDATQEELDDLNQSCSSCGSSCGGDCSGCH